jgi:signal transduction histidine kinase
MTNILVIEDEEFVRQNVADILEFEGFSVIEAENGVVGTQLARECLPDLVMCDVMMPEKDGHAVLEDLRNDPLTATIPFIFLTAMADASAMRHGMELGADDYLTKPFSSKQLVSAVHTRLERRATIKHEREQHMEQLRQSIVHTLPHELRTPLLGILGCTELIIDSYSSIVPEDVMNLIHIIDRAGQRLHGLIKNYLLYAGLAIIRSDPERTLKLQIDCVDQPGTIIANCAEMIAAKYGRENDLILTTEDCDISISGENVNKLAEELIDNAFKFSKPKTSVTVTANRNDMVYTLCVSDEGRGMTPDDIQQVGAYMQFGRQQFEQQGSGLGLIISKYLAEIHRGDLMIESMVDEGTTVTVNLPVFNNY